MSEFSLDLDEDQTQLQKWLHDFAENVIRPAAHEWDEREETPWPIIQEAANIGLYSFDFVANAFMDKSGLLMPIAAEELAWVTPASPWPSWAARWAWPASPGTVRPSS